MNPSEVHTISPKELEEILLHFSKSMTDISSEEELLWDLVGNCISKLNFEDAVVYLLDEKGDFLVQRAAYGPKSSGEKEIMDAIQIPIGKGITGKVVSTGLPILVKDTRNHPDYILDDQFRLSEVAVPILLEGKVIGVIDSENSSPDYFSEKHVRILNAVASIYSGQIARIRAEKRVKEEQQKLLDLQRRNYQFQLDALSAQLSPHFVFNSLNSIQNQIFREDKETSLRFLSTFSKLLRYFLNQLNEESTSLKDEIQMVRWFLELQQLRYGEKMNFQIHTSESLKSSSERIPSKIIQNLIENLLEEQIQQANGEISIRLDFQETSTLIQMTVWINQSPQLPGKSRRNYNAHLVQPWEEFIQLLNEIKPYKITFETQEKPCPQGLDICKCVRMNLPIINF